MDQSFHEPLRFLCLVRHCLDYDRFHIAVKSILEIIIISYYIHCMRHYLDMFKHINDEQEIKSRFSFQRGIADLKFPCKD